MRLRWTPAALFDFGSRDNVDGYLKLGPPRRYTGVVKDDLWDESRGWGFVKPRLSRPVGPSNQTRSRSIRSIR